MQEDVFKKTENVYAIIQEYMDIERDEILKIISRLVNGFHNKSIGKKRLTKQEAAVYEILLNNKYNPSTVYRWLLVTGSPKEIQNKLRSGEITIKEALQLRNEIRKQFTTNDDKFIDEVIWCVEEYVQ